MSQDSVRATTSNEGSPAGPAAQVRLSVIVPCYNDADVIPAQLEALASQEWEHAWELVVADNGSTDQLGEVIARYRDRFARLCLVDASGKKGPAYARNVGAANADGDLLLFVDADDEVAPGWLAALGDALQDVSFVASRHDFSKLNAPHIERSRKNAQDKGLQPYRKPPFLPHASGSGLGIRRDVFEAVGGFDEELTNLQDTDLCWRVQLAGTELHFVPDAVVHYRFRSTVGGLYVQGMNYGEHNVLLYKKFRPHGMPPANWRSGVRAWIHLLLSAPDLLNEDKRLNWIRNLGWRIGRLKGCIKYRVFAP